MLILYLKEYLPKSRTGKKLDPENISSRVFGKTSLVENLIWVHFFLNVLSDLK
jgi:hypothetical protein